MYYLFNFLAFILLSFSIILVTKKIMIYNIRRIAIFLRWKNNIVGQLLGYATSTPELIGAIVAGSLGMVDTSIMNVLSSNIVNLLLVIIISIIFGKFNTLINKKFRYDYIIVFVSIIVPYVLYKTNYASKLETVPILIIVYLIYLLFSKYNNYFAFEKEDIKLDKESIKLGIKISKKRKIRVDRKKKLRKSIVMLVVSIFLLYILGTFLGNILENLGKELGVPEIILGIVLGIITSIPETITFITSFQRHRRCKDKEKDKGAIEVINNLATSNVSNLAIIQTVAIICYIIFA